MTKQERELTAKGYRSVYFVSSRNLPLRDARKEAKDKAAEYRAQGFRACVVETTSKGRIFNSIALNVWRSGVRAPVRSGTPTGP